MDPEVTKRLSITSYDPSGRKRFEKPSIGLNIGHALIKCARLKKTSNNGSEWSCRKKGDRFTALHQSDWADLIFQPGISDIEIKENEQTRTAAADRRSVNMKLISTKSQVWLVQSAQSVMRSWFANSAISHIGDVQKRVEVLRAILFPCPFLCRYVNICGIDRNVSSAPVGWGRFSCRVRSVAEVSNVAIPVMWPNCDEYSKYLTSRGGHMLRSAWVPLTSPLTYRLSLSYRDDRPGCLQFKTYYLVGGSLDEFTVMIPEPHCRVQFFLSSFGI